MDPTVQFGSLWPVSSRYIGPDILVMHFGGYGLARHPGKALILDIIQDLNWLKARYPVMQIVWSTIILHLVWRDALFFLNINTARRSVNYEVCRAICSGHGLVISHQRIQMDRLEFFQNNGVHLSDLGLDVMNNPLWAPACYQQVGPVSYTHLTLPTKA